MSCYNFRKSVIENCDAFKNNCCFNPNCGLLHKYKYCYKYQNTICDNDKCPFLHCTSLEQLRYESTGKETEQLKREVGRTLQSSNICGDFKKGVCRRQKCRLQHIGFHDALECPVCRDEITIERFGAVDCGHVVCWSCALRCLDDTQEHVKIKCPICRHTQEYQKLS